MFIAHAAKSLGIKNLPTFICKALIQLGYDNSYTLGTAYLTLENQIALLSSLETQVK